MQTQFHFHFNIYLFFNLGGYGTMEELLEIIAWSQFGIHEKPVNFSSLILFLYSLWFEILKVFFEQVGLLNVCGYYNSLLALFDKGVEEGFIEDSARQIVVVADSAEELIKKLEV